MSNNLIKNETKTFYVVKLNNGFYIEATNNVLAITDKFHSAVNYKDVEFALRIARRVKGKVIKHTRTVVETEITEEISSFEEEK